MRSAAVGGTARPRGRAVLVSGVAVVLAVGAFVVTRLRASDRGPAFDPVPEAAPIERRDVGGVLHLIARESPATLRIDTIPPDSRAELLWYQGRVTNPLPDGDAVVVDTSGTLLAFSDRLTPRRPAAHVGTRTLTSAAAGLNGSLWVSDFDGTILHLRPDGEPVAEVRSPFQYPILGGGATGLRPWVARSPAQFGFGLDTTESPVAVALDTAGAIAASAGRALLPEHILLRDLANAGFVAVAGDTLYFAPFIRDELVAMGPAGDTLWVASRALPQSTPEPRFEMNQGRPEINYHPVNLGLRIGPDGHLYLLSTPGFTMMASRLDVFDRASGALLRTGHLDTATPTLAADPDGRVYALDPLRLLVGSSPAERPAAPDVTLPLLGGGEFSFRQVRGKVVLVNVWASWCLPCREEMPALDALQRRLAGPDFAFIALNEDENVQDARAFLDQLGVHFTTPLGRGSMRTKLHYPGLPFTVILDREGRVASKWIGYAGPQQMDLIETRVRAEIGRTEGTSRPPPIPAMSGEHGGHEGMGH